VHGRYLCKARIACGWANRMIAMYCAYAQLEVCGGMTASGVGWFYKTLGQEIPPVKRSEAVKDVICPKLEK